jgi:catechol 2,3-dioxygenase-like lactoylglutathione lyase family enzyme
MKTGHIGLNVPDVGRALPFYTGVFGWDVLRESADPEKRFAFLGDRDGIVVTLWQQSDGGFATDRPGLHHLAFEVGTMADVQAAEARVRELAVHDERRLSFPDYPGNSMFMTLGNVAANPRAGLLFIDWETGDTLQLTGAAVVDWSPERASAIPGAERVVDFAVDRVIQMAGALPLRWVLEERSRFNPPVGA